MSFPKFVAHGNPNYAYLPEKEGGTVVIWMNPDKNWDGIIPARLWAGNLKAPEESNTILIPPIWQKGSLDMILRVRNVNAATSTWHITWDVLDGEKVVQTIHVTVKGPPPPEVKVDVIGG